MNIVDISWPITPEITAYKDRKTVEFQALKVFEHDHVRETKITLSSHTGTHIDVPSHFIKNGTTTEHIQLNSLIGNCKVLDLTSVTTTIMAEHLASCDIVQDDIIVLKTSNSELAATALFNSDFIYLDASAAKYLVEKKIKTIGIDYLGIERNQPAHQTHIMLLSNAITIIEGLRLQSVPAGNYFLCCLPLAVIGLDGAPARAILMDYK